MTTRVFDRSVRGCIAALAVVLCPACGTSTPPRAEQLAPTPAAAQRALEQALDEWHSAPPLERTTPTIRPVMFVDQQRRPGQRLREYTVLGEAPGADAYRQFRVKLVLEGPDESLVASYYVFGQGPLWVYRADDLDMLMHMDHAMMVASQEGADVAGPTGPPRPSSEHHHPSSPSDAREAQAGPKPAP